MKLYLFRGKAATGKTLFTNALSNKLNISVLRKDDIFDSVSQHISDNAPNNCISYDLLAKQIQTNIDNDVDLIVDVGLSNIKSLSVFLKKIDLKTATLVKFYCDCSNNDIWTKRLEERLKKPHPNQFYTSIKELIDYYDTNDVRALDDEILIDSANDLSEIIALIMKGITR